MKKKFDFKRIIALLAVVSMSLVIVPTSFAAQSAPKDEVVYANMSQDGRVKEIFVVNSFELLAPGTITDYGNYEKVTDLTAGAISTKSGDAVTVKASAGKLSYQGKMAKTTIPWDISVRYFLNGNEMTSQNLGGKSGALRIVIKIMQNKAVDKTFFEHYAMQVGVVLNAEKCKNIVAKDATIANAGANKQLAFVLLPGTEQTLEVTADVTDFEMSGISFNGVSMNMSFDFNALLSGDGSLGGLGKAFKDLNVGTKSLVDGASQLNSGIGSLKDGAADIGNGLSALSKNSSSIVKGAEQLVNGMLSEITAQLNAQLTAQGKPNIPALTLANYTAVFAGLLDVTDAMRTQARAGLKQQIGSIGDDDLTTALVLANAELATNPKTSDAVRVALGKLAQAGKVGMAMQEIAAAGGDPLKVTSVSTVLGAAAAQQATTVDLLYKSLVAGLQKGTALPDAATCAAIITVACDLVAGGSPSDLQTALAQAGAAMQAAGEVNAAAGLLAADRAAKEKEFLTAMVVETMSSDPGWKQLAGVKAQIDGLAQFYSGIVQYTG
ncbi:MAG: hypothetical protein RR235_01890, partial [Oscillospiraceae bacterium]